MEYIKEFYLPQLQAGEVVNFHNDTLSEITDATCVGEQFPDETAAYRASVGSLNRTYDVFAASELSAIAKKLDARRRKAWSSFKTAVKLFLNDEDDHRAAESAERIMFIVRSAINELGDPIDLGMTKCTSAIDSILRRLEPTADDIEQIGAMQWIERLAGINGEFSKLQIERDVEKGERPSGNMGTVRIAASNAYKELVADINAYNRLNKTDEKFVALVKTHNATIEKYLNIAAQRKGRSKKSGGNNPPDTPDTLPAAFE